MVFRLLKAFLLLVHYGHQEEVIDTFSYKSKLYHLYPYNTTYIEAKAICQSEEMRLIAFDDLDKIAVLKESMEEAKKNAVLFWTGGKKTTAGEWVWDANGKAITDIFIHNSTVPQHNCLAFQKEDDSEQFVAFDCSVELTYMCEELTYFKREPEIAGTVTIADFKFILFYGDLTWAQSVSYCRQAGLVLSTVYNMHMAQILSREMVRIRPEMDEAWIGATKMDDSWFWASTGTEIVNKSDFPPWNVQENYKDKNCALLRSERLGKVLFVKRKCHQSQNFICTKTSGSIVAERFSRSDMEFEFEILHNEVSYLFFPIRVTWDMGLRLCQDRHYHMLKLRNLEETQFLAKVMFNYQHRIYHLWIGGNVINGKWRWIEDNTEIPMYIDYSGFPPWCDNALDNRTACLNMDGKGPSLALMYGLECDTKQGVVCSRSTLLYRFDTF